jgi:RNA polymerase sigma-70 factor, ECF subfamily
MLAYAPDRSSHRGPGSAPFSRKRCCCEDRLDDDGSRPERKCRPYARLLDKGKCGLIAVPSSEEQVVALAGVSVAQKRWSRARRLQGYWTSSGAPACDAPIGGVHTPASVATRQPRATASRPSSLRSRWKSRFQRVQLAPRNHRRPGAVVIATVEDRPLDERTLVAQAKRGDVAAYERLVERHQTIAFRTAWLITGSAADAEEAAQDAFLKAYRALGRFREGRPLRPWLLKIVGNEARNRRVSAARRERLWQRAVEERRDGDAVPSPEAALLDSERRAELLAALGRLPAADREVIACRYLLDLSEVETAGALGCARGTVKSRLSRALERLRDQLGERDG